MKFSTLIRPLAAAAVVAASASSFAFAQNPSTMSHPMDKPATAAAPAVSATVPTEARRITIDEVKKRMDANEKVLFVDARSAITGEMVKGALHIPISEIDTWAKDVPKDTFIVAYCACGSEGTSMAWVSKVQQLGFTNSFALKGGIMGWQVAGLPTQQFVAENKP